jgi:hypothetical protein
MEQLQRLFLGEGVRRVKFHWLVFYGIAVVGFVFVLLESYLLAGNPMALRLFGGAPFYPWHLVWIAFGAAGALLAFKRVDESGSAPASA